MVDQGVTRFTCAQQVVHVSIKIGDDVIEGHRFYMIRPLPIYRLSWLPLHPVHSGAMAFWRLLPRYKKRGSCRLFSRFPLATDAFWVRISDQVFQWNTGNTCLRRLRQGISLGKDIASHFIGHGA